MHRPRAMICRLPGGVTENGHYLDRPPGSRVKYFGPRGGSIINIGSTVSQLTPPNLSIYTATRGALDAITRVLAKELGPKQIRVNSINPGAMATEGARAAGVIRVGSDFEKQMIAMTPLGRIGQPSHIALIAVLRASDESG